MPSYFDKALNVAAANRTAAEELEVANERKKQQDLEAARSLAAPYLKDLGPQVMQRIRTMKVAPEKVVLRERSFLRPETAIHYWPLNHKPPSSWSNSGHVNTIELLIHENETFYCKRYFNIVMKNYSKTSEHAGFLLVQPAVLYLEQALSWIRREPTARSAGLDETQTFVDPETRKVYIKTSTETDETKEAILEYIKLGQWGPIMELGAYVAHKIR